MPGVSPKGVASAGARVLLCTADPVFAALCARALEAAPRPSRVVALAPDELLAGARQHEHDVVVLDADRQDSGAIKKLASKVLLVSGAPLVLVSAYLGPGAAELGSLLQSIPARFVQKPQGSSSLGLAGEDGPPFAAALQEAFRAHHQTERGAEALVDGGLHG